MNISSNPKGVYQATKKDGTVYFRSSLTCHGKHISLGSFHTAGLAHKAYTEGCGLLNPENTSCITDYSSEYTLPFEKWVSLINLRDNDIYFGTPIYLHPNFFEYCLSKNLILKFDIDDLFFYSSHKILRRNGHLFVSDYGMQTNIMSRYGIKNYARPGIDYRFINGDTTDFRYENIEILNFYHGVTPVTRKGKTRYKCQIHIHGNYSVGEYGTALDAAIAYNKAIDILKKNGLRKNFAPNYIEDLSPSEYADRYFSLKISDRIRNYFSS